MSVSGFEHEYFLDPGVGPIHARPAGMWAATAIGGSALLVLFGFLIFGKPKTEVALAPPASGAAIDAPSAQPSEPRPLAFDLGAPEFAKEAKAVTVRTLENGGREDSLTLGQFGPSAGFLRLDIRSGADKRASSDFYLDLTHHASDAGLSALKIGAPAPFATRFGAFEVGDIKLSLAGAGGAEGERVCQAMRLAGSKHGVEITGIVCGAGGRPIDRRALPCLVDRLEYRPAADKAALAKFFEAAAAERSHACGQAAGEAEKADWLEAHSAPPAAKASAAPLKPAKKAR